MGEMGVEDGKKEERGGGMEGGIDASLSDRA